MVNLSLYKDELEQILNLISQTFNISSAIYDSRAELIACTETYELNFGRGTYKPPLINVLGKDRVVNSTPGEKNVCAGCVFYKKCPAIFEISKCVYFHGVPIGVLIFASFSKNKYQQKANNLAYYLEIIENISKLISTIIENKLPLNDPKPLRASLGAALNISNTAYMAIDLNGTILAMNEACQNMLTPYTLSNPSVFLYFPDKLKLLIIGGTKVNNYAFRYEDYIFRIDSRPIKTDTIAIGAILKIFITEIETENNTVNHFSEADTVLFSVDDIKGTSSHICEIREKILKIADSPSTVFISGETGTGKGLLAKAIHHESRRRGKPFITVNCSGIPESLIESELFGYEEGAFTGAKKGGKPGKFELADGGTLFLDEISEVPLNVQVKLLNVLQERSFDRIGGTKSISVDVRIIAASNRDMHKMIEENKFRADLFYRLNILPIHLLPLRERQEDLDALLTSFLNLFNQKLQRKILGFDNKVLEIFRNYSWPGNIRQLQNVIEYCVNLDHDGIIMCNDLPENFLAMIDVERLEGKSRNVPIEMQTITKELLLTLLDRYSWSVQGKEMVARSLNISLRTLYRKMSEFQITKNFKNKD